MNQRDENISTNRTNVLMQKEIANPEIARILHLNYGEQVFHINSVLEADQVPVAFLELILPIKKFAKLKKKDLEQSKDNLYSVYQRVCGVTVLHMEERVYARCADRDIARALKIDKGAPILVVDRLAFTFDNNPVEIRRRTFQGLGHYYLYTQNRVDK